MPGTDDEIVFDETQHAWRNGFLVAIMACESMILTAVLGGLALQQTGRARIELIIVWALCVFVIPAVILGARLRTRLTRSRLRVWFAPFPGWKIDPADIAAAESRKLSPLGDLGGWGYRWARKHGHVMNVHGERFVTVTLRSRRKRTIGTQRPEELLTAIRVLAELPPDESEIEAFESEGATV